MRRNHIIIAVVALVAVGGGSFFGGMKYAEGKGPIGRGGFANISPEERKARFAGLGAGAGTARGGQRGGMLGGNFAAGEVIAKDDKSITIRLGEAGSRIVFFSEKTQVTTSVAGSLADLVIGATVTANGTANPDGSMTADTVMLRPSPPTGR